MTAYFAKIHRAPAPCSRARHLVDMQARWTPADDAGPLSFSTNRRERSTYANAHWARRDRPVWMPEPMAALLLDELDWPLVAVYVAVAVALGLTVLIARRVIRQWRQWRSDVAARALMRDEARRGTKDPATSAQAAAPVAATEHYVRHCRFCDIPIEDAHVDSHQTGKKHRRLKELAGALAAQDDCWVWRPPTAPPSSLPIAASAPPSAADEDVELRRGGGDGGKGSWSAARTRRRR